MNFIIKHNHIPHLWYLYQHKCHVEQARSRSGDTLVMTYICASVVMQCHYSWMICAVGFASQHNLRNDLREWYVQQALQANTTYETTYVNDMCSRLCKPTQLTKRERPWGSSTTDIQAVIHSHPDDNKLIVSPDHLDPSRHKNSSVDHCGSVLGVVAVPATLFSPLQQSL